MADQTEAEVVRDIAYDAVTPKPVEIVDGVTLLIGGPNQRVLERVDTERYGEHPRRTTGTVDVHTAAAFIQAVQQRGGSPVLYADEERRTLVAILNDDTGDAPGWRDLRVQLASRPTPEWTHWEGHQGLKEQSAFADIVDVGLRNIVQPPPTDMLELAQTFQATVGAKFAQQGKLQNGQRQFTYTEEVAGQAGENGALSIPEQFELALQPFFGSRTYKVLANLRWQVRAGDFRIGYLLVDLDVVLLAAFTDIKDAVATGLGVTAVAGVAPPSRVAG